MTGQETQALSLYDEGIDHDLVVLDQTTNHGVGALMDRVKIAGASARQLKVIPPGAKGKFDTVDSVEGVVIASRNIRQRWGRVYDENEVNTSPPLCTSADGSRGIGDNGSGEGVHDCLRCPKADPDNVLDEDDRCSERMNVYLLTRDAVAPALLDLAPTSFWPFSRFAGALLNKRRALSSVLARVTAEPDGRRNFSRVTFTQEGLLDEADKAGVAKYVDVFKPVLDGIVSNDERRAVKAARERLNDPDAVFDLGQGNVDTSDLDDDAPVEGSAAPRDDRPRDRMGVPVSEETAAEWESIEDLADSEVDGDPPAFG